MARGRASPRSPERGATPAGGHRPPLQNQPRAVETHRGFLPTRRSATPLTRICNSRLYGPRLRPQNHALVGPPPTPDAPALAAAIRRLATAIADRHRATPHLLLLGIANGGRVLASRLVRHLHASGLACGAGTIDISFHRDDIGRHPIPKEFAPTAIPHDIHGATVILVDDVLHSGRTVKAALDELFDHGRPDRVELAVLVDRGGRRLPLAADYRGLTLAAPDDAKVVIRLDPRRPALDSLIIQPAPAPTRQRAPSAPRPRALA